MTTSSNNGPRVGQPSTGGQGVRPAGSSSGPSRSRTGGGGSRPSSGGPRPSGGGGAGARGPRPPMQREPQAPKVIELSEEIGRAHV